MCPTRYQDKANQNSVVSVQEHTNSLMKQKTEPRNTETYMETGFIAEQMLKIYKEKDGP